MRTLCRISFTADGKLDIFKGSNLAYASVPIAWLECYLASHGICEEEYKKVIDQLNDVGTASVIIRNSPPAR